MNADRKWSKLYDEEQYTDDRLLNTINKISALGALRQETDMARANDMRVRKYRHLFRDTVVVLKKMERQVQAIRQQRDHALNELAVKRLRRRAVGVGTTDQDHLPRLNRQD